MTKYAVIGGAGSMGRIAVKDLLETAGPKAEIAIADYDLAKAQELAASLGSRRLQPVRVDIRNWLQTVEALKGTQVILNCLQYDYNLDVMEVALALEAHYTDLGGLFYMTRKQLELHKRFQQEELTAVIGMGAAPGTTNLLARYAIDRLDTVAEIHIRLAYVDKTRYKPKPALGVSYSLKTILEEFSFEPAVFTKGRWKFVKPMSGAEPHRFPAPVGVQSPMHTIHSEVATLPVSYRPKGVQEVTFKIAFDPEMVDRVRFLRDLGLASHEPVDIQGTKVAPVDVVNKVAMSQPVPQQIGEMKQYEIIRSVVKGQSGRKKITWIADCHVTGMPEWDLGTDVDTGSPPSIIAQMIASGQIQQRGVLAPEVAVDPEAYFEQLKRRHMHVQFQQKPGWDFTV